MLEQSKNVAFDLSAQPKLDKVPDFLDERGMEEQGQSDDDEEQLALEEISRQHSNAKDTNMLEQKIMDLCGEIDMYRRDKDEVEVQLEQLALNYEIFPSFVMYWKDGVLFLLDSEEKRFSRLTMLIELYLLLILQLRKSKLLEKMSKGNPLGVKALKRTPALPNWAFPKDGKKKTVRRRSNVGFNVHLPAKISYSKLGLKSGS